MQTDHEVWINVFDEQSGSIVKMELADVVKRITANELPDKFESEAAKALAVAVRSQVAKKLRRFDGVGCINHRGADICTSMKGCSRITDLKMLKEYIGEGFEEIYDIACKACESTSGLIITCGGKPIEAEYHLVCGGGTENSEDVLGNRVIYLRKVLCSYCSNSHEWDSSVDVPVAELEEKLGVKLMNESSVQGPDIEGIFEDADRDETGRIRKIRIGGRLFTGIEIKNILGLNSSRFGWDPSVIRFRARGHGHGLGMCLYGAESMAQDGRKFNEIIKYYYTNVNIEDIGSAGDGDTLKGRMFVIDPGHGGEFGDDERGASGLREKDVNLYIAKKLAELLEKNGGKAMLTRDSDIEVPLPQRIEVVNSIRPNFFISIHQNGFFSPGVSGTEVYYFRGDSDGEKMSKLILGNIVKSLGTVNRGSKTADFYILRESKVSAVVAECMYITNKSEEQRLRDDTVKDEIAKSIYRAILEYYGI